MRVPSGRFPNANGFGEAFFLQALGVIVSAFSSGRRPSLRMFIVSPKRQTVKKRSHIAAH
jgi:hypothetical protein